MQTRMPKNLDIDYKFFNGQWTFKEIGYRLLGLPVAIPVGIISFYTTNTPLLAVGVGIFIFLVGAVIGSIKVFDKQIPLLTAIIWSNKLNRKSKLLFNKRDVEQTNVQVKYIKKRKELL